MQGSIPLWLMVGHDNAVLRDWFIRIIVFYAELTDYGNSLLWHIMCLEFYSGLESLDLCCPPV